MNGIKFVVDIIFDKTTNGVNVQMTGPNETTLAYFNHALTMILMLWLMSKIIFDILNQIENNPIENKNISLKKCLWMYLFIKSSKI